MKILCGIGELRYMGRADSIQNSGCTYEQITGVQVENGDNILFTEILWIKSRKRTDMRPYMMRKRR